MNNLGISIQELPYISKEYYDKYSGGPYKIVGYMYVKLDERMPEHDGYCSDGQNEDMSIPKTDMEVIYEMYEQDMEYFSQYADRYGNIDKQILEKTLNTYEIGCGGCGCCGLRGYRILKSGRLITPEYVENLSERENIEKIAYYKAEEDNFTQDSEYYWKKAEADIVEYKILNRKLLKILRKNKRHKILKDALEKEGLRYRWDSKLCEKWENEETDKTLEEVVRIMAECKWCIEHHGLFDKMDNYIKNNGNELERADLFSVMKEDILKEHPLPENYPWKV